MFRAATNPFLEDVKICPIMTNGHETVLCQRSNCYAAYPVSAMGETLWYCALVDGPNKLPDPQSEIIVG
jgi:hypothetical protein